MSYLSNKEKVYIDSKSVYDGSKINLSEDSPGFMGFEILLIYLETLNEYSNTGPDPMDPFYVPKSFECFFKEKLDERGLDQILKR